MNVLGADELRAERLAFMVTIESLRDEEFGSGRTLCAHWAPRDVLAHLIGTTQLVRYVRHGLRINEVNAQIVAESRPLTRAELTIRGRPGRRRRP